MSIMRIRKAKRGKKEGEGGITGSSRTKPCAAAVMSMGKHSIVKKKSLSLS
jgi:hypothetical protein